MPVLQHDLHVADGARMMAMRAMLAVAGRPRLIPDGRPATDEMMAKIDAPAGVRFEPAEIAGVGGWWCRVPDADPAAAILYLHGGAYVMGSAAAYRHFAGQIALRAGADTFVVDYARAPERAFPAAFVDALAVHDALREDGRRVALCGDSAGGGLALALLLETARAGAPPVAAAAMSPWIDLSCAGETMETRAGADPLLSRATLEEAAGQYLGAADPHDPRASALEGDVAAMPPVTIHVGDDEVLLDDTVRFVARAEAAGRDCAAHVWSGMVHVFPANLSLHVAREALTDIGSFLRGRLGR